MHSHSQRDRVLSLTANPELHRMGRCYPKEVWADRNNGAAQELVWGEAWKPTLIYMFFFPDLFRRDESLCKYKFTRLHNLHVKWGQFSHEVHKPAEAILKEL